MVFFYAYVICVFRYCIILHYFACQTVNALFILQQNENESAFRILMFLTFLCHFKLTIKHFNFSRAFTMRFTDDLLKLSTDGTLPYYRHIFNHITFQNKLKSVKALMQYWWRIAVSYRKEFYII